MRNLIIKLALSLVVSVILIHWLISQGFDVLPDLSIINSTVAIQALWAYIAIFCVFNILRAWRWIYLLRPFSKVPLKTMMSVAFVGFAAIQMMPFRTGEIARPYLLDRYTGISKSALFGTIAIERVIDGLMVSLWLSAALLFAKNNVTSYMFWLGLVPLSIFAIALFVLIAFYCNPTIVKSYLVRIFGVVSKRLSDLTAGVLDRFHDGLAALPDKRNILAFISFSMLYWGINAVGFLMLARGCGLDLNMSGAIAGMGCLAVGILLPAGPGYFGNFQVSVLAALAMYLPDISLNERASVFVFLLYAVQTGLTLVFGGLGALALPRRSK